MLSHDFLLPSAVSLALFSSVLVIGMAASLYWYKDTADWHVRLSQLAVVFSLVILGTTSTEVDTSA